MKQCVEVFLHNKEGNINEKTLVKALNDPEMIAVMMSDVKISVPGMQKIQREQKKAKKEKKRDD